MRKNYEFPISIFEQTPMMDMCDTMDGLIISAVRRVGIDVNKEELVKAMAYDRGQYEKGYKDGYQAGTEDAMEQKVVCDNCQFYRTDSGRSYCCLHHSTMRPDGYCSLGVKSGENNN